MVTDLQELEVGGLDVLHVPQLAGDRHAGRREIDVALARVKLRADAGRRRHALQPLEKIEVKELAAELAVGDALQPDRLLRRTTSRIASSSTARSSSFVICVLLETPARVLELRGAQQAAHVVGAEWRVDRMLACPSKSSYRVREA